MTVVKKPCYRDQPILLPSEHSSGQLRGPSGTAGFWWVRFWCRFLAIRTIPFLVISGHVSGYVSVGASAHPDSTILKGLKNQTGNPFQTYRFDQIVDLGGFGAKSGFGKTFQVGPESVKNGELWKYETSLSPSGRSSGQLQGPSGSAGFRGVRLVSIFSFRVTFRNLRGPSGTAVFLKKQCFWCLGKQKR